MRYFMMALACLALAVSPARAGVVFGDGGAALQGVLDGITSGGPSSVTVATDELSLDEFWAITGQNQASATLIIELAGFASTNIFGVYDLFDPTKKVALFGGSAIAGDQATLSIKADGSVFVSFTDLSAGTITGGDTGTDFAANAFGFYLDSSAAALGGLFFSDTSLNTDGVDHLAAYVGTGDTITVPGGSAGTWTANEYVLAWEDLYGGGDKDFTDFVAIIESVESLPDMPDPPGFDVPEPTSVMVWALLVSVVTVCFRRRR